MKKLLLVILVCSLFACCAEKSKTIVITGKTTPGEAISLQQSQDGSYKLVVQEKPDSTGYFRLEYNPERAGLYMFSSAKNYIPMLIKPGEEMEIDLTSGQTIFGGDAVERNQFMKELRKQESVWAKEFPKDYTNALNFRKQMELQSGAFRKFLEQSDLKDEEVKGILEADALIRHYTALLKYPFFSQLLTGGPVEVPDAYYSFFEDIDLTSPYLMNLGYMSPFLQDLFLAMEENGYLKGEKDNYLLKRAEWISNPEMREAYLLYVIDNVEMFGYNQYLGQQMEKVKSFIETPEGRTKFKELTEKYVKSAKENERFNDGQPAVDFSGVDEDNSEHRLSDYKGKVVVVDVWNTGCKPCIAEIPFLKKLEKQFEGKEVVFISYAVEANPEAWKEFIRSHEMGTNQWINTEAFKSPFAQAYQVRFIPRFMVFGKDGTIVDVYAPRPSSPRLAQLIEEELNK